MGKKNTSRWAFALSMMTASLAWLAQATSPTSPGGTDVTKDEVCDFVVTALAPLGITVDPVLFKAAIKELA